MDSQSQEKKRKALAKVAVASSGKPLTGKRKAADRSGEEAYFMVPTSQEGESSTNGKTNRRVSSSPLSSPPPEEDVDDTEDDDDDDDATNYNRGMILPKRQAKALKMDIEDSPGYRNTRTTTAASGSGRAGIKKPTKMQNASNPAKAKRVVDRDDGLGGAELQSTAKKALPRTTRAKRGGGA
jgi:hypothetical protein